MTDQDPRTGVGEGSGDGERCASWTRSSLAAASSAATRTPPSPSRGSADAEPCLVVGLMAGSRRRRPRGAPRRHPLGSTPRLRAGHPLHAECATHSPEDRGPAKDEQFDPLDVSPEGFLRLGRHDECFVEAELRNCLSEVPAPAAGDAAAAPATFTLSCRRGIASMAASLDPLDALVFTGETPAGAAGQTVTLRGAGRDFAGVPSVSDASSDRPRSRAGAIEGRSARAVGPCRAGRLPDRALCRMRARYRAVRPHEGRIRHDSPSFSPAGRVPTVAPVGRRWCGARSFRPFTSLRRPAPPRAEREASRPAPRSRGVAAPDGRGEAGRTVNGRAAGRSLEVP